MCEHLKKVVSGPLGLAFLFTLLSTSLVSPLWAMGSKKGATSPPPAAGKKGAPVATPAVPEAIQVILPKGTLIRVQLNQILRASVLRAGSAFSATLREPLTISGQVIAPMGSPLDGFVSKVVPASRFLGGGSLELHLTRLVLPDQRGYLFSTEPFIKAGKSNAFRNISLIAAGGIVGVGLGSILGQTAGALIGMGIGGATGGILAWVTGQSDITLPAGSEAGFILSTPVTVTIKPVPARTTGPKQRQHHMVSFPPGMTFWEGLEYCETVMNQTTLLNFPGMAPQIGQVSGARLSLI